MKKMKRAKGSFTLEAAVITAISMFIICASLLMAFNIHDRTVMGSDLFGAVIKNISQKDASDIPAIQSGAEQSVRADMIKTDTGSVAASFKDGTYTLSANGSFDWIFSPVRDMVSEDMGSASVNIAVSNLDGRARLLKYKQIKDLLKAGAADEK